MRYWRVGWVMGWLIVGVSLAAGCSEEVGDDELCDGEACESACEGDDDCQAGEYCDEDEGVCIGPSSCEVGDTRCEGDTIARCNEEGVFVAAETCNSGVCSAGQCRCGEGGDCADGESCVNVEICDDGICESVFLCREECEGAVCGASGELCCQGDTPECSPSGHCAPSCEGQGQLCGGDFDFCCPEGDVCVFGDCRTPGDACQRFSDCDFDQYCDLGIERCMDDDFPEGLQCVGEPDFDAFDIEELWHWSGVQVGDLLYENVQSIPVTADMTGDGSPEVVITPYANDQGRGILAIISGETGQTVYHNAERFFSGQGHSAVADITGDGMLEIAVILGGSDRGVALVQNPINCPDPEADADGCILWEVASGTLDRQANGMGPLIADLNRDGNAEVIVGAAVINGVTGEVIADGIDSSRGHNGLGNWGSSTVADLDGDGTLELLTGDCAWKVDFDEEELVEYWCNDSFSNGIPAVADIVASDGRDGLPEVAVVRSGVLYILNGQTGDTIYEIDVPGGGDGGAPNIADFDGDGTVEIGLPGRECYSVFDVACIEGSQEPGSCEQPQFPDCTPGEDCVVDPCPALEGGVGEGVLWSIEVQDRSMTTGSSVFDFQGNQRNEVVYNDECRLLVLDGQTGQPLISRLNTTRTASEYPLVVDVNGDGRSNIVLIANRDQFGRDCEDFLAQGHADSRPDRYPECFPDDPDGRPEACDIGTSGIYVLQDVHDAWVRTRAIWNQHAYHITNINDDGTLPDVWTDHWTGFNTFRANRQGEIPLNQPDVAVTSVQVNALNCPPDVEFRVTISNLGMSGIPAGLPVSLVNSEDGQRLETFTVAEPISPGATVVLEFNYTVPTWLFNEPLNFMIVANDDGSSDALVQDCNPETATAEIEEFLCRYTL